VVPWPPPAVSFPVFPSRRLRPRLVLPCRYFQGLGNFLHSPGHCVPSVPRCLLGQLGGMIFQLFGLSPHLRQCLAHPLNCRIELLRGFRHKLNLPDTCRHDHGRGEPGHELDAAGPPFGYKTEGVAQHELTARLRNWLSEPSSDRIAPTIGFQRPGRNCRGGQDR
jgi:hypothetical protein